jgi:hypothetical protein
MMKMEFFFKQAYSELIPRLAEKDYQRLKKSIREYGQQYPILVNTEFRVLDGHHRLRACHELGIPVSYTMKDFVGKPLEELKFVCTVNVNNRQLSEFQRAQVALKFKKLYAEKETNKERMKAWYFTKTTGKEAAVKRWYGDTENLIEEYQSVFGG